MMNEFERFLVLLAFFLVTLAVYFLSGVDLVSMDEITLFI